MGEWQQDSSSGNTTRVLSYTIALNNPLGPKTAPVVETQVLTLIYLPNSVFLLVGFVDIQRQVCAFNVYLFSPK